MGDIIMRFGTFGFGCGDFGQTDLAFHHFMTGCMDLAHGTPPFSYVSMELCNQPILVIGITSRDIKNTPFCQILLARVPARPGRRGSGERRGRNPFGAKPGYESKRRNRASATAIYTASETSRTSEAIWIYAQTIVKNLLSY
jgi:hypothetical protein